MKIHRFFISDDIVGETYVIQDEALVHQITRVLRIGRGECIALVVGGGKQWLAEIVETEKRFVTVRLVEEQRVWISKHKIVICLSAIRKERFEWALEKCTEVGASAIIPLISARTERGIVPHERALRIMQEASEQCGRGDIPEMVAPITLADFLSEVGNARVIACDMGGMSMNALPHLLEGEILYICIGPEGGWSNDERAHFTKYGIECVTLGPTVLRAETAAVAACVLAMNAVE